MWLLFKETAKGIFYTAFSVSVFFFSIKQITEKDHEWYIKLFWIFGMLMFFCTSILYAYYTILLPSKLKEGHTNLDEIMLENNNYVLEDKYFIIKNLFIWKKKIYLDTINQVILEIDEESENDIYFGLRIEYSQMKMYIPSGYVENFLEYFLKNLEGFDKSIQGENGLDFSKIEKYPITLYEKSKLL